MNDLNITKIQDDDSHWYWIPNELLNQFKKDLEKITGIDYMDDPDSFDDFIEMYDHFRTLGDPDNMPRYYEQLTKENYYYSAHGLQFIVYRYVNRSMGDVVEDSRWTSEQQAKEHCRLLNMNPEELEKECRNFHSRIMSDGKYDEICSKCQKHSSIHL